jgi:tripartite ATP-independent transporter DctM subunit
MSAIEITVIMFVSMLVILATGLPIAFGLGSIGILSAFFLWGPESLNIIYFTMMSVCNNFIILSAPMFVLMGFLLHRSGIADDLFNTVYMWAGGLRGGLGMGTVGICAVMAAMVGGSGAATLSMGVIAVPAMLSRKYNKRIALGLVQAGGALGLLIPPSFLMILYGFISGVSVGKLFAGGVIPGFMLALFYIIYIGIRCYFQPHMGPAIEKDERVLLSEKFKALKSLIAPGFLIFAVLGCIFLGITSPTEAAAVGAAGAMICAAFRKRLTFNLVHQASLETLYISGLNFYLITGAMVFSKVYTGLGATAMIKTLITGLDVSPYTILILMQCSFFLLGMFLDDIAIMFMCMPIYVPIITTIGFDPVWFAVLFIVNMQMAILTPPYGLNLFYMKAVAPKGVSIGDIYRSVLPFVAIQMFGLILMMIFPEIILFLPKLLFNMQP